MGYRQDSFIGLNAWALHLIKGNQILAWTEFIVKLYPSGVKEQLPARDVYTSDVICAMSGEHYEGGYQTFGLRKFTFPDGIVLFERVQQEIHSSGPVIFTALYEKLKHTWVPQSRWGTIEMKQYV